MASKIKWYKQGRFADGYVGKIWCFQLVKESSYFELTCTLPGLTNNFDSRSVLRFKEGKKAVRVAEKMVKLFLERINEK